MPRTVSVPVLLKRVQQLVDQRQKSVDAIAHIDETLKEINRALGFKVAGRLGRPPGTKNAVKARRKGRRRRFEVSGDEFVLGFIQDHRNSTTKEINKAWAEAGRGGSADNTLTKLVKTKMVKREPLEGQRGSKYIAA